MKESEVNVMPVVRISLNDESYEELQGMAKGENLSIQDYIRKVVFKKEATIFTVEEAVRRIQAGAVDHLEEFTLPDVYSDEWVIERGPAGVFGKNFFNYVEEHTELGIHFKDMGKYGRRATYILERR